jgi:hypothetical protein
LTRQTKDGERDFVHRQSLNVDNRDRHVGGTCVERRSADRRGRGKVNSEGAAVKDPESHAFPREGIKRA